MFTALAATILFPSLIGVAPKKIQKAFPVGQYPRSPLETTFVEPGSRFALTGMLKYISLPQQLFSKVIPPLVFSEEKQICL
ncbi:MAG: hypothetical protein XE09_0056 [Atribacteria bacterium 34_868]|nr:MAG: hypothetical protein XE09_0056 [Atribacteria bacterium 34_868]